MKRILFVLVFLVAFIEVKADIWYYIQSGHSPEESNATVHIVIKDNSGQLWMVGDLTTTNVKSCLLKNRNFYIDTFNQGTHVEPTQYSVFGTKINDATYRENMVFTKYSDLIFYRLIVLERTQKSFVCKKDYSGSGFLLNQKYAFSLDFKTMVEKPDAISPLYYTAISVDKFIVRRNIDDLF